jgi:hypothetical protein
MMVIVAVVAVCAAALAEIVVPGHDYPYHAGWFNVALLAAWIAAAWRARVRFRAKSPVAMRVAVAAMLVGSGIACLAAVASGLLGPDARTVIGAPGQRIKLPESGDWLEFPLSDPQSAAQPAVTLQRSRASVTLDRTRQAGAFVFRPVQRDVVFVDARDAAGNRLTITQPEGQSFLSPVLVMTQTQNISGLDLPFDGFSVPSAKRNVKAVLFSERAAAALRGVAPGSGPAVLFAVDDERGQPVPHCIALSAAGLPAHAGGLVLSAKVLQFPAIQIVSAPPALPVFAGTLLAVAGIVAVTVLRRSSTPPSVRPT